MRMGGEWNYTKWDLKVYTTVNMSMFVFCVATLRGMVSRHRRFGETYCLHLRYLPGSHYSENWHRHLHWRQNLVSHLVVSGPLCGGNTTQIPSTRIPAKLLCSLPIITDVRTNVTRFQPWRWRQYVSPKRWRYNPQEEWWRFVSAVLNL
jgi:hypothetical protein